MSFETGDSVGLLKLLVICAAFLRQLHAKQTISENEKERGRVRVNERETEREREREKKERKEGRTDSDN